MTDQISSGARNDHGHQTLAPPTLLPLNIQSVDSSTQEDEAGFAISSDGPSHISSPSRAHASSVASYLGRTQISSHWTKAPRKGESGNTPFLPAFDTAGERNNSKKRKHAEGKNDSEPPRIFTSKFLVIENLYTNTSWSTVIPFLELVLGICSIRKFGRILRTNEGGKHTFWFVFCSIPDALYFRGITVSRHQVEGGDPLEVHFVKADDYSAACGRSRDAWSPDKGLVLKGQVELDTPFPEPSEKERNGPSLRERIAATLYGIEEYPACKHRKRERGKNRAKVAENGSK